MRGHEEASGTKYYPEGLQEEWAKQDPVSNYELFLKENGVSQFSDRDCQYIIAYFDTDMDNALSYKE
jgi:TPP-dependent pyruvate/acetoin dehydrogenase alpha subunit